jgi:hypothetical protein
MPIEHIYEGESMKSLKGGDERVQCENEKKKTKKQN